MLREHCFIVIFDILNNIFKMTSCAQQKESVSTHTNVNINKCALKLVGFEFGNFTDEELLEFISYYVPPSSIKTLFYDSYNSFYVLHLSDIEHTSVLIGKTLRFGTELISFLPLIDCFVIGNVYPTLSNNDIFEIFSVFGKVFDVAYYHVLPNSSKFFHVLSGTREINFLLAGCESKVEIPKNVVHSPYIFHTEHLCVGCQTQGHSLINCPDKIEEVSLPSLLPPSHAPDNVTLVQELTIKVNDVKTVKYTQVEKHEGVNVLEKSKKDIQLQNHTENCLSEKPEESIQLQNHTENCLSKNPKESIQLQKQAENSLLEISKKNNQPQQHVINNLFEEAERNVLCEKPAENILSQENNTETDSLEEKPNISLLDEEIRKVAEKKRGKIKMAKRKRKELAKKRRNALPDIIEIKHPSCSRKIILEEFSSPVKSCIKKSKGVIPVEALNELLLIDARNQGNVIAFVLRFTSNIKAVLVQLSELKQELESKTDIINKTQKVMFEKKIFIIVKLLKNVLCNSY